MKALLKKLLTLIVALIITSNLLATTIYVNSSATGSNNGTSWANAYTTLESALSAAVSSNQIWVAKGVYYATTSSFQLKNGVEVYGGFAGAETLLSERDWSTNISILSGDKTQNDMNIDGNFIDETWRDIKSQNASHVVKASAGLDASARLDGFVITGGIGNDSYGGGGVLNDNCSPTYTNLLIIGNQGTDYGGGMLNIQSSPILENVRFEGNRTSATGSSGGGMYNHLGGNPTLKNVIFNDNSAYHGGGMGFNSGGTVTLDNVTFTNNSASGTYGGGIYFNNGNPIVTISNSTFTNNNANMGGGICYYGTSAVGTLTIDNTLFSSNTANSGGEGRGGGLFTWYPTVDINNTSFIGNSALKGGGVNVIQSTLNMSNSIFKGNLSTDVYGGGGLLLTTATGTITNVTFNGNKATNGGALSLEPMSSSQLTAKNCILWGDYPNEIFNYSDIFTATYCNIQQESSVYTGTGNINSDPKFVEPVDASTAPTTAGNLLLPSTSPCVNVGNNSFNTFSTDIRGQARIQNSTIDMGAYEWTHGIDAAVIIYVKQDATGNNDGTSWTNAYTSLQSALNTATTNNYIYIAKGTYKPSSAYSLTNTPRYYHFELKNNVGIYGGFAGTETSHDQRTDFGYGGTNETILSGDIGTTGDNSDNCLHVIYNPDSGITNSALLDGVTITGGNANNGAVTDEKRGGAIYMPSNSPTISNVIITGNYANYGGGAFNMSSSAIYNNCLFFNNNAGYGGAVMNYSSTSLVFNNCTFYGNNATGHGGGVDNWNSALAYNNCIFWGNTSATGNQIYGYGNSTVTLNYSCFSTNSNDIETETGSSVLTTNNNITSNPQFVNSTNKDFRLYGNSPCVNTANNSYNKLSTDIRGKARIQNTTIDMGAYEWTSGTDPANNLATGTENNAIQSVMLVYPNPSNGLVNFHFAPENGDKTTIDIFSITGELVYRVFEGTVEQGTEQTIQFKKPLAEGLYIYKMTNGNQIKTGRLIRIKENN